MENTKTIATNKKAFHEYFVIESFEAGIELSGTEVKSVRQGGVNLKDAWCSVDNGEMIIKQMHISPMTTEIYLTVRLPETEDCLCTKERLCVFSELLSKKAWR